MFIFIYNISIDLYIYIYVYRYTGGWYIYLLIVLYNINGLHVGIQLLGFISQVLRNIGFIRS